MGSVESLWREQASPAHVLISAQGNSGLLASRTERRKISIVLKHQVCDNLLQQSQKTKSNLPLLSGSGPKFLTASLQCGLVMFGLPLDHLLLYLVSFLIFQNNFIVFLLGWGCAKPGKLMLQKTFIASLFI